MAHPAAALARGLERLRRPLSRRYPKSLVDPPLHPPPYRGRHPGRTFLVLGSGPSLAPNLDRVRVLASKHQCLVMGSNNVGAFLSPDYHCFTNRTGLASYGETVDSGRSRVLIGAYIPARTIRRHYRGPFERIPYVNDHEARFSIHDGVIQTSCRTVSMQLVGVALVMGATRVLLAGVDGYGDLVERGEHPYAYAEDEFTRDQERLSVEYFRGIDRYQGRFLAEIADYMRARDLPAPAIVTPTAYEAYREPIERYL